MDQEAGGGFVSVTLHTCIAEGKTLAEALKDFAAPPKTPVLLYAPRRCLFGRIEANGSVGFAPGPSFDLASAYEARAFHLAAELRWWNDPSGEGKHRAVVVSEGSK